MHEWAGVLSADVQVDALCVASLLFFYYIDILVCWGVV